MIDTVAVDDRPMHGAERGQRPWFRKEVVVAGLRWAGRTDERQRREEQSRTMVEEGTHPAVWAGDAGQVVKSDEPVTRRALETSPDVLRGLEMGVIRVKGERAGAGAARARAGSAAQPLKRPSATSSPWLEHDRTPRLVVVVDLDDGERALYCVL